MSFGCDDLACESYPPDIVRRTPKCCAAHGIVNADSVQCVTTHGKEAKSVPQCDKASATKRPRRCWYHAPSDGTHEG
jgi:hypothetical protein